MARPSTIHILLLSNIFVIAIMGMACAGSPSETPSPSVGETASPDPGETPDPGSTPNVPPETASNSATPIDTPSPSATSNTTPADTAAPSPTPIPSPSPTLTPGGTHSPTEEPSSTPAPSATPGDPTVTANPTSLPPPRCAPPLELTPTELWVIPYGLASLAASGGTGAYQFRLQQDNSGALLNSFTGVYLAGAVVGVDDVVEVTDDACVGSAITTVHVVRMQVEPLTASVRPGTTLTPSIGGGSGSFGCSLTTNSSGANFDPTTCTWTAGTHTGTDRMKVQDVGTGEVLTLSLNVSPDSGLEAMPDHLYMPEGNTHLLKFAGGSGIQHVTSSDPAVVEVEQGLAISGGPGVADLTAEDLYTSEVVTITTEVSQPLLVPSVRGGDQLSTGQFLTTFDIDGDGWEDAAMGTGEADITAWNSGAVFLWRGAEGGLAAEPAQVIPGLEYSEEQGRSFAVADVDNDGDPDLVVGGSKADRGAGDNGVVRVHLAEAGLWHEEAAYVLPGNDGGDYFGTTVAACDVDGDGWQDVVVGAPRDEDNSSEVTNTDQGAVYLFYGGPEGYNPLFDQVIFGRVPDNNGDWVPYSSLRMGSSLAAGDIDQDGHCDVVVGAWEYDPPGGGQDSGASFLFLGGSEGLSPDPVVAWAPSSPGDVSHFGRALALVDVVGDGHLELLVGQYRFTQGSSGTLHGAARLYVLSDLTPSATFRDANLADWSVFGDSGSDGMGWSLAAGDYDQDGQTDILVAAVADEITGGANNAGVVSIFPGTEGGFPSTTPSIKIPGATTNDWMGQVVAMLEDQDGDGKADLLLMSGRDDNLGPNVGRPYLVDAGGLRALDFPGEPAGQAVGRGVSVVGDLTGDGIEDVVVGAPNFDGGNDKVNSGEAWIFSGTGEGLSLEPYRSVSGWPDYSGSDALGYGVATAGDFDGDGKSDLAVLARSDGRPTTFGTAYANRTECAGAVSGTGSLLIFKGPITATGPLNPTFIYYGPQASGNLSNLAGGFDFNGDGFDDLLVGSQSLNRGNINDAGGMVIIYGRPAEGTGIRVICNADVSWYGLAASDNAGFSVAALGDINADGCDEVAVGAYSEDLGYNNQGTVRIFYGKGTGCRQQLEGITLAPQISNTQFGYSLAGGEDVDGDQIPDLAVGAIGVSVASATVGAAWLLPGAWLASLTSEPVVEGQLPNRLWAPSPGTGRWRVEGTTHNEQSGYSVALVPHCHPDGRAGLAVGAPQSDLSGTYLGGGVRLYQFSTQTENLGLSEAPFALFSGETFAPGGRVGDYLAGGSVNGQGLLLVTGSRSDGLDLDQGAVWAVQAGDP